MILPVLAMYIFIFCYDICGIAFAKFQRGRRQWKRCSKWVRAVLAAFLILIPVGVMSLIAYAFYSNEYGRWYLRDEPLSKNVVAHGFQDYKYRVYNKCTGKYTTKKINWVSDAPESDSLAVYALPNRRGFINAKNEVVIPFQFDYSYNCRMCDFCYLFHNGYCIMTNKDGDLGLIDQKGNWVVEPVYDEIWAPHKSGYRIVVNDGRHGILDSLCSTIYPTEYDYVDVLSDGFILTQGGKKWQVDFDGNTIQSFLFDGTYYLHYPIGYNECGDVQYAFADYLKYRVMDCYGIMNRTTGNPITPAIYSDVNMLSKDLFEVQELESNDWYIVDIQGNVVQRLWR